MSREDQDPSDLYANLEYAAPDDQCETLYYTPFNEVGFGKDPEFIVASGGSALGAYLKDRLGANSKARPLRIDESTDAGSAESADNVRRSSVASSLLTVVDGVEVVADEKEMDRLKKKILKKQAEIDKVERDIEDKKIEDNLQSSILAL